MNALNELLLTRAFVISSLKVILKLSPYEAYNEPSPRSILSKSSIDEHDASVGSVIKPMPKVDIPMINFDNLVFIIYLNIIIYKKYDR